MKYLLILALCILYVYNMVPDNEINQNVSSEIMSQWDLKCYPDMLNNELDIIRR